MQPFSINSSRKSPSFFNYLTTCQHKYVFWSAILCYQSQTRVRRALVFRFLQSCRSKPGNARLRSLLSLFLILVSETGKINAGVNGLVLSIARVLLTCWKPLTRFSNHALRRWIRVLSIPIAGRLGMNNQAMATLTCCPLLRIFVMVTSSGLVV